MDSYTAKQCHEQMVKFITAQGNERALAIRKQGQEDYEREKAQFIEQEKERIKGEYITRYKQDEIKLKIQRSAVENSTRINRMQTVNGLIERLYKEAKVKIVEVQQREQLQYKELLKDLIVQVGALTFKILKLLINLIIIGVDQVNGG